MKSLRFVLLALFLAACGNSVDAGPDSPSRSGSGSREQAVSEEPLPGIALDALSASEKRDFYRIVGRLASPCGTTSIAQCVRDGANCPACARAARYLVRLLESGYPADTARDLVKLRYARDTALDVSTEGCSFRGNPDARVTIVEFADFECPHCKQAHEMFDELFEDLRFASTVRLCYRYFPITGHENARPAARAAVAASNQGKFWQMHDLIYDHQTELSPTLYTRFAQEIGLDLARFQADFENEASDARVQRDREAGERLEIEGTPSFFVNGRRYEESLDPDSIRAYVREELE